MKYRISDLEAANTKVISVHPESALTEATSKMALNDFSQLPVMSSERKIHGVISWKSIGVSTNLGSDKAHVKDCMDENVVILKSSDNLLDSVSQILEKEFVFIKNENNLISGIITIYDIALQFQRVSEPFIEIQLIENSIRKVIDNKIGKEVFGLFCKEQYPERKIESSRDLNFGEYIGLISNKEVWKHFKLNLDRKVFIEKLECIRLIRNDIMHFRIKELTTENIKNLKDVSKFFRMLEKVNK